MSSHASRCQTCSHRYAVFVAARGSPGSPPRPSTPGPPEPWLNGRNTGLVPGQPGGHERRGPDRPRSAPASGPGRSGRSGCGPCRYWCIACSRSGRCWFFNSAVATGIPLTTSSRSTVSPAVRLRVVQLPGHREPVGLVELPQLGRQVVRRREVREVDLLAEVLHSATDHVDSPPCSDLVGETSRELALRLVRPAVQGDELLPRVGLGCSDERVELGRVQPERLVVVLGEPFTQPLETRWFWIDSSNAISWCAFIVALSSGHGNSGTCRGGRHIEGARHRRRNQRLLPFLKKTDLRPQQS